MPNALDVFTAINANHDEAMTWEAVYTAGGQYVFRVVVTGWVSALVQGQAFANAQVIASCLAAGNSLDTYEVVGICVQQSPAGAPVNYYDAGAFTLPFGKGYNATLVGAEDTWLLDIVLRARVSQNSYYRTTQAACAFLKANLNGMPLPSAVYPVGLLPFDPGTDTGTQDMQAQYDAACQFWRAKQSYLVVTKQTSALSTTGFSGKVERIHVGDAAWASYPPYLGQDGAGLVVGDALFPDALVAYATAPVGQTPPQPGTPSGLGPSTGDPTSPPAGTVLSPMTSGEKAIAVVSGVVGGYAAAAAVGKFFEHWAPSSPRRR